MVVEFGIFLAESVVGALEFHVLASSNLIGPLVFALGLEGLKTVEHLLADLLGRFQVVVKLLFIDAVLGSEEFSESGLSLLKVGGLT